MSQDKQNAQSQELMDRFLHKIISRGPHGSVNRWKGVKAEGSPSFHIRYERDDQEIISLRHDWSDQDKYTIRFAPWLCDREIPLVGDAQSKDGKMHLHASLTEEEVATILIAVASTISLQDFGGKQRLEDAEALRTKIANQVQTTCSPEQCDLFEVTPLGGNRSQDGIDPGLEATIERDELRLEIFLVQGNEEITLHGSEEVFELLKISSLGGNDVTQAEDSGRTVTVQMDETKLIYFIIGAIKLIAN